MDLRRPATRLRATLLVAAGLVPVLLMIGYLGWTQGTRPGSDWRGETLRLVLVAGLGLAVGWLGSRVVAVGDLSGVGEALRRLSAGDLTAAAGLPRRRNEVGRIAGTVEALAETLAARQAATERAEVARRAVEARLAPLLDVDAEALVVLNQAQRVLLVNRGAERIFGYTAKEMVGQAIDILLPSAVGASRRPTLRELAAQPGRRELVGRRRAGGQFPADVSVSSAIRDGQTAYTLIVRDLTEGQRADAALRESEARFRGAFDHSASGMALQGLDGRFVRVNRALRDMLGYEEQELLATTHQTLVHPDEPEPESWYERDLLSGAIRWYQREQRYLHKRGDVVWGLLSVSLVRGGDGRPAYFLVQVHDITERKRAEELEAQLRQSQKIEAVGQLAAGVAHDFNNLLMVITGRSHILIHHLGADHPLRRHVDLIQTTALRAGALTQQLLAFSRKQVLAPRILDVNQVVEGMVPMLRRLIGEQIDLITVPAAGLGRVKADAGQLEQVILNLAVNARDAMPEGGRLTIETVNVELDERFVHDHRGARSGAHVALSVRDTGSGMDAATRARLFEPFFTTKTAGKGTGLGLATVYGIVKQSGGYIAVDSEPGKGATFTMFLPRVEASVETVEAAPESRELPRGTETVLLVEDEEAVRDLAREILVQSGYTVIGARHGGEALLIGDQHAGPIHVLVTDVVMPELGGRELANRLAARRPGLKVVYMSGYTDETLEHHGVLEPGMVFLRKPLTPDTLARKVREILDTAP
ncbi:MAG TPA: PAS domain S-box protein [Methylomirabilota bacterium]|nr:PAS domain S-box protein [Methylomirabilota bacterium]